MKINELKAIANKYGMEISRNPITGEGHGVHVSTETMIPELDALADTCEPCNVQVIRTCIAGEYNYYVEAPKRWFDRWGWSND